MPRGPQRLRADVEQGFAGRPAGRRAGGRAGGRAYVHWLVFSAAPHPTRSTTCTPLCLLTLLAGTCYAPTCVIPCAASRVANVGRGLGLGWHGTQHAVATRRFPSPHPSQRQWGSLTGAGGPPALGRSLGLARSITQPWRPKGHTAPSSHLGRLRRLPEEMARRTRLRRSPSAPPSPPSPRAEGPSPWSHRLCCRRRRVRLRCRATRQSGPSSLSCFAATATAPLLFKPHGCLRRC